MGARSSKTKPNAREDGSPGRPGTMQTFIVTVDTQDEVEDEVQSAVGRMGAASDASKVSKVQEILEGRVELRQQQLEHLPHTTGVHTPPSLELQFSSSEESDESDTGQSTKKRKGARKKKKKPAKKNETAVGTPASPLKLKLSEIKPSKKTIPPLAHPVTKTEHFEQIKDAYSMIEYTTDDAPYTPKPVVGKELRAQEQQIAPQQLSPVKPKQQPSPGSSPSNFFSGAYDSWKRTMQSSNRSGQSVIMETRDSSRRSPPKKTASNSSISQKSASSQNGDRKGKKWEAKQSDIESDTELEEFERESARWRATSDTSAQNQSIELKVAEGRGASATATPQPRRPVSERRNLRIDDTDESIMDDILAEVIE